MKKKMFIPILVLIIFAAIVGIAKAYVLVSIRVEDQYGNNISGKTVPVGTVAYVSGYYEGTPTPPVRAVMAVFYSAGPEGPWVLKEKLFDGWIDNRTWTIKTYEMKELGYYNFTWAAGTKAEHGIVSTMVGPVVPEPGTLIGLTLALSAVGLYSAKSHAHRGHTRR